MGNGFSIGSADAAREREAYPSMQVQTKTAGAKHKKANEQKEGKTIFAGNMGQQDAVSEKFALAQKTALRKLLSQFEADADIDGDLEERATHVEELRSSAQEEIKTIRDLDSQRETLKAEYEIAPDSQEQKDLELMQKANAAQKNPLDPSLQLTEEEQKRLEEMPPLTEYQEKMLGLDEEEEFHRSTLERQCQEMRIENETIWATKKALLKVHPMVDAAEEADAIIEAARKELLGSLLDEGVDQVDENTAKAQEQIAENQEKALEKKIELEKQKEERAEKEQNNQEMQQTVFSATMQTVHYSQQVAESVQSDIKSLIQEQTLLDVDVKGLRVNQQV